MQILNDKLKEIKLYIENLNKIEKLILILSVVNPFIFLISPLITIFMIIIEISSVFCIKENFRSKFWKAYLLACTFLGVSIFKVKVFDLLMLIFIPLIFIFYKNKVKGIRKKHLWAMGVFGLFLIFTFFRHPINGRTIAGLIRYLMCIAIFYPLYKTIKSKDDFIKLFPFIRIITIATLITGFIIAIMNKYGLNFQHSAMLYSINCYNASDSFRESGFFGDPNKFYSYFTLLLAFYEFYSFKYRKENIKIIDSINFFLILGIVLSFSRTGITAVLIYIIAKYIAIILLKADEKKNQKFWIFTILVLAIVFICFNKEILNIMNGWIYSFTKLIGRSKSLVYSSSVTGSSRVVSSKLALETIKGHLLLGRGFDYWETVYYMPACDSFINILQDSGVIALGFFATMLSYSFRKVQLYITLLLVIFPLCTMNLQHYTILYLFAGLLVIDLEETTLKKSNEELQ